MTKSLISLLRLPAETKLLKVFYNIQNPIFRQIIIFFIIHIYIINFLTFNELRNGSHFWWSNSCLYLLEKLPTYERKADVKRTSPGRVLPCSLNFSTDSAQRTFSDARPPTSRLAKLIVLFVVSASSWHRSFSAVAFSKEAVSSARLSSSSYKSNENSSKGFLRLIHIFSFSFYWPKTECIVS